MKRLSAARRLRAAFLLKAHPHMAALSHHRVTAHRGMLPSAADRGTDPTKASFRGAPACESCEH